MTERPEEKADRSRLLSAFQFGQTIAQNIRIKVVSDLFVKAGRFFLVVLAARLLEPEQFGLYTWAFSLGNILANVSDFGLQVHLSREIAQHPEARSALLSQAIRGKGILTGCALFALALLVFVYPRPWSVKFLLVLAAMAYLAVSWTELWNYFFRGMQQLGREARLNLGQMLLGASLAALLLVRGHGPAGLFVALLTAALITTGLALRQIASLGSLGANEHRPARIAVSRAAPIGVAILLSILYFRVDVFFLERMLGDTAVGAYGAAYRILESLLFVPAAFLAAIYPAFSEAVERGPERNKELFRVSLLWMVSLSAVVVTGLVAFAPLIIGLLYGEAYAEAGPILRALAPSLLFIFPNYALTHFLIALQGQKWNALFAGVCLAINAVGNVFAIARWGPVGAALTTVLTEATLFVLCWIAVRRRLDHGANQVRA